MIIGKIIRKTTTNRFEFRIEKDVNKYDYVQVWHEKYGYVIAQIIEIELSEKEAIAKCIVLGYLDEKTKTLKPIKFPLKPLTEVLKPKEDEIKEFLRLNPNGLYIGLLRDTNIKVMLEVDKLITKHLAVLAKTGAGKSYTVGVILEELIEKGIPALIIDSHGEYVTLNQENDDEKEIKLMPRFGIKPKAYNNVQHYGHPITNAIPLTLKDEFNSRQLMKLFPKLNATQKGLLFEALKGYEIISLKELMYNLMQLDTNKKWSLISVIEEYVNSNIFSENYIQYNELIQPNRISIIDLKGFNPKIQETIVFKLLTDIFELRKLNKIPPCFIVIEEAHNFCPERNFGERMSSEIIRTIASEGRKFGIGLAIISQRPSRVDKNVLSQCNTQIIMKVTNPNDLKAIVQSVEGIYEGAEDEIKNLPIGNAFVAGVLDVPIIVEIRPRKTKHGGKTVNISNENYDTHFNEIEERDFKKDLEEFKQKELLPVILPKLSERDIKIMYDVKRIKKVLYPVVLFECDDGKKYNLLMELINGKVVTDIDFFKTKRLPNLKELSIKEIKLLEKAYLLKEFTLEEIINTINLLDVKNVLKSLVSKKYLIHDGNKFKLNDEIILSDLKNFEINVNINYLSINYDEKLDPKIKVDELKEELSNFTKIIKHQLAWLLVYKFEENV